MAVLNQINNAVSSVGGGIGYVQQGYNEQSSGHKLTIKLWQKKRKKKIKLSHYSNIPRKNYGTLSFFTSASISLVL